MNNYTVQDVINAVCKANSTSSSAVNYHPHSERLHFLAGMLDKILKDRYDPKEYEPPSKEDVAPPPRSTIPLRNEPENLLVDEIFYLLDRRNDR